MFFYTVGSVLRRVHYNVLVYIVVKLFHFVFFLLFLYLCLFCVFVSTIMVNIVYISLLDGDPHGRHLANTTEGLIQFTYVK